MRGAVPALLVLSALAGTASSQSQSPPKPAFRFSPEAGRTLTILWQTSVAARQERVACLASTIRHDTVFVSRVLPVEAEGADSMSIGSAEAIEQCGPPKWSGTVHTHVAMYSDSMPSTLFSAQDRGVMRRWYQRWHADGVFCLLYSARDAHCEADGVVGGLRSRPRLVR
ncbi:MAG: hypothetical protein ACJ8DC_12320 [Gemmatimonadales bacterium]